MPQSPWPQPPQLPNIDWTTRVDFKTQNEIFKVISKLAKRPNTQKELS